MQKGWQWWSADAQALLAAYQRYMYRLMPCEMLYPKEGQLDVVVRDLVPNRFSREMYLYIPTAPVLLTDRRYNVSYPKGTNLLDNAQHQIYWRNFKFYAAFLFPSYLCILGI